MTSRRRYLAGLGTLGLTALAGCGSILGSEGGTSDRIEQGDLDGWSPDPVEVPSRLPFSLPEDPVQTHETRTRTLLDRVPADPSIPNTVIEDRIREEHARVEAWVQQGSDAPSRLARLGEWRRYRGDAANLVGSYNAGTGTNDAELIDDRRRSLRSALGEFEASIEYAAGTPIEAVLVYAPIEDQLRTAAQETLPHNPYPEDPGANVEQAGAAFESVEAAAAALDDARGIRESYLASRQGTGARWSTLIDRFQGLEIAVDRTRAERIPDPEDADHESLFARDLEGVELELFRIARRSARFSHDPLRSYRQRGRYANAVLAAGRRLAAIAAFDAVITALESGPEGSIQTDEPNTEQSVASLQAAATDASETLGTLDGVEYPHLSSAIGDRAVGSYRVGRRNLEEEYFDPEHAEASFRYASLFGALAPDAASFVVDHVEG